MDLVALEFFYVVAQAGSVSRAASDLGVEQSTLTRHITRLEHSVGMRLFHRSGRGMVLTEKGQAMFRAAEEVVGALSRARRAAAELAAGGPAKITIASQPTIANATFGAIAHALKHEFPKSKLRFVEGLGSHIIDMLQDGDVDVALLYQPTQSKLLDYEELLREDLYCICPASSSVPRRALSGADLLSLPMVLPSTVHGLKTWLEALAQEIGIAPNIAIECDGSTHLMSRLVQQNHGYTILPMAAVKNELAAGTIKAVKIDHPRATRTVVLATPRGRPQVDSYWKVAHLIKQTVAQLVQSGQWPNVQPTPGSACPV
ncbi:LysR family transcriptional regulator [Bordetella sp. 15P40C-2]|uniref:LysR family transcriptional regulator n=1 Tax=Bordetella sp. 15P40C-2 TaxID=2572246 RepID=UPI001327A169|nr:LysR family transcriptional regulator [Bordetella sp. 15P40C-2]MVW71661.1 LysR family transcriptional regulator [Bordetella sp. 15P40C-2]